MSSVLSAPRFHNEDAAFAYVEALLWPSGPTCPHCGECERIGVLKGATTRPGLRKCYSWRKPFTVRMGTIFESGHCPLHLWLQAIHLLCSSTKGISTRQLQRTLGVGMKTARFLGHRIREAMAPLPAPARLAATAPSRSTRLSLPTPTTPRSARTASDAISASSASL